MSLRKPKLSWHIKLNHTNIALLLQEAKQKYRKLTDYRTKCCYLSALASFAGYFQFLDTVLNIISDHSFCI